MLGGLGAATVAEAVRLSPVKVTRMKGNLLVETYIDK